LKTSHQTLDRNLLRLGGADYSEMQGNGQIPTA